MEAIAETPANPVLPNSNFSVPALGQRSQQQNNPPEYSSKEITKCQFELGSLRSVQLYVKQFSEIFTEDGRRYILINY